MYPREGGCYNFLQNHNLTTTRTDSNSVDQILGHLLYNKILQAKANPFNSSFLVCFCLHFLITTYLNMRQLHKQCCLQSHSYANSQFVFLLKRTRHAFYFLLKFIFSSFHSRFLNSSSEKHPHLPDPGVAM